MMSWKEYLDIILRKWKMLLSILIVFAGFGVLIAVTEPKVWNVNIALMPELAEANGLNSSLGGLAGLAGIDISNSSSSNIDPEIYPEIIKSTPFLDSLLNQEYFFRNINQTSTVFLYLKNDREMSLKERLMSMFNKKGETTPLDPLLLSSVDSQISYLSSEKKEVLDLLSSKVGVLVNKKTGIVTISIQMQDPVVCAQMANYTLEYLKRFVEDYRSSKILRKLDFIKGQYEIKNRDLLIAQGRLAAFQDRNFQLTTAKAKAEERVLQSQYDLTFSVFNTIANQLEETKISFEEKKPVFKILEPAYIPETRIKPKRMFIVMSYSILGVVFGIFLIMLKHNLESNNV